MINTDKVYHVASEENCADIITRGKAEIKDFDKNSHWQAGQPWMKEEFHEMPIRDYNKVCKDMSTSQRMFIFVQNSLIL